MKKATSDKKAVRKSSRAADAKGRAMVADLKELICDYQGGIPIEPSTLSARSSFPMGRDIMAQMTSVPRAIRLGQPAVFAYLMGVSVKLVQAGSREPGLRRSGRGGS